MIDFVLLWDGSPKHSVHLLLLRLLCHILQPVVARHSKGLPTPRLTAGQEDSHQAALRRSNRLLQPCISSLVSALKCSIFFIILNIFSIRALMTRTLTSWCCAKPAPVACIINTPVEKTTLKFIRSAALHMEPISVIMSVLWADLHWLEQSCPHSEPRHLLVSLQHRRGVWLVNRRRGDGAASQGRDLSGSRQKVFSIKRETKVWSRLVVCRWLRHSHRVSAGTWWRSSDGGVWLNKEKDFNKQTGRLAGSGADRFERTLSGREVTEDTWRRS